jgi:hypothetical protein
MAYTPDQVAQAFIDEGMRRGVNPIGIQEAICAGLDESGLRVLANPADPASEALPNDGDGTDHASEGALQQQPPWWGTVQCRMDPTCSVGMFYDHLVALPTGYTDLNAHTPGWYIQQVQQSFDATGNNYMAQWNTALAIYNRLHGSTGGPGIPQENVDLAISIFVARIGDSYVYGGAFDPVDVKQGTDCSGMCDTILQALTHGTGMQWGRHVSTESWPYDYANDLAVAAGTVGPYGTICAGDAQPGPAPTQYHYAPNIPSDAAAVIYLMHGGGGENSHMMIAVNDGTGNYIVMETGGAHNDTGGNGQYASVNGSATSTTDPEWTDIWYLPGPIGGTQDMDAGQNQMLTDLHNALCQNVTSTSRFRLLGEGANWTVPQLAANDDGFSHEQWVEWAAERGDAPSLALLETLSAANPLQYPDRATDITFAQTVLARVQAVLSGQTPPNVISPNAVVTQPVLTPPAPQPIPEAPAVAPAAAPAITTAQLSQWAKDAATVLGVLGTWATALHGVLGQYLSGGSAVTVPSLFGAATVAAGYSTVHRKNQLLRENTRMKALAPQRKV